MGRQWASSNRRFLDLVFERLDQLADWPRLDVMQRELDRLGERIDLIATARTAPRELGSYDMGSTCATVTIRALSFLPAAEPLLQHVLAVVRLIVDVYLSPDHDPNLTQDDVRSLGLDPLTWKKVSLLLENEWFLLNGGRGDLAGDAWDRVLPTTVGKFRDVATIEDYVRVQGQVLWDRPSGPLPGSLVSAPPATDTLEAPSPPTGSPVKVTSRDSTTRPADVGKGMTQKEILRVVNKYIGVAGGYLGDFSYRTHGDFYPEYCDLDIDPHKYEGTTRERFIAILASLPSRDQAKVLRGVIERFPVDKGPDTRTATLRDEIRAIAHRLETGQHVPGTAPKITSEAVLRAIADAETLLTTSGPVSAVDRIHTALHGHLLAICDAAGITYPAAVSLTAAFKLVRIHHPMLSGASPQSGEIDKILNSCANILDAMNPVRNQASVAHPNRALLGEEEARLVINVGRSLLNYLDSKLHP